LFWYTCDASKTLLSELRLDVDERAGEAAEEGSAAAAAAAEEANVG